MQLLAPSHQKSQKQNAFGIPPSSPRPPKTVRPKISQRHRRSSKQRVPGSQRLPAERPRPIRPYLDEAHHPPIQHHSPNGPEQPTPRIAAQRRRSLVSNDRQAANSTSPPTYLRQDLRTPHTMMRQEEGYEAPSPPDDKATTDTRRLTISHQAGLIRCGTTLRCRLASTGPFIPPLLRSVVRMYVSKGRSRMPGAQRWGGEAGFIITICMA